jgi:hypothetical protein
MSSATAAVKSAPKSGGASVLAKPNASAAESPVPHSAESNVPKINVESGIAESAASVLASESLVGAPYKLENGEPVMLSAKEAGILNAELSAMGLPTRGLNFLGNEEVFKTVLRDMMQAPGGKEALASLKKKPDEAKVVFDLILRNLELERMNGEVVGNKIKLGALETIRMAAIGAAQMSGSAKANMAAVGAELHATAKNLESDSTARNNAIKKYTAEQRSVGEEMSKLARSTKPTDKARAAQLKVKFDGYTNALDDLPEASPVTW